ncbi:LacI family DNA-binding transcriptional regulator [Paratissierella segnis]|jgi:LacI family transcriptional regulator|uniref:LacI family DNA-binding transcriptional regulator n=1 Tax=Paratissierella segnis TaxID=2763679 RepID=A0A926IJG5_9FIRM|nr:LacI family DNA-binding transcriptional regulator [Paratissierella segnis]MBC8587220.1 LacI family DNA-binding transcriptional regulator [Paratissierella segnis]
MTVTIKDIAKVAGVSKATVSRSLNDSPLVAETTRERIKDLADTMGFEFNANARSLSTSKTGTVGIIYPERFGKFGVSLYYSSLLNQIRDFLEKEELDNIVAFPRNRYTGESNIKRLIQSKKIDGLLIIHPNITDVDQKIMNFIEISKMPYVFLHHYPSFCDVETVDAIYTNHFGGGYDATKHLIDLGHRNIICLTSYGDSMEFRQRTEGYRAALIDNNIEINEDFIFRGYRDIGSGYKMIKENMDFIEKNNITGMFSQTDLMAIGVMEGLKEFGKKIPDDYSIVGYDDIEMVMDFKPNLTTIHQPREEIAILTCNRLLELINGVKSNKKVNISLSTKLIIRESTKKIE